MPIRPEELSRYVKTAGVLIAEDRPCRKCGYNLIGLKTDANCPECGRPIREGKRGPRFGDQMIDAPMLWLRTFRRATALLMLGGWIMSFGFLAWAYTQNPKIAAVAFLGAAIWSIAAIIATRPRPRTRGTPKTDDLTREWHILRLWARLSQPLWCAGITIGVCAQLVDVHSSELTWLSAACLFTALIGCWPLLIIQSNLAYWAADTDLADRLRVSPIALGIGLSIGAGAAYILGDNTAGSLLGTVLILAAWAGPILLSLGYVLLSYWQLWRMASWIMLNQAHATMRDDRLRARATRARAPVKPL